MDCLDFDIGVAMLSEYDSDGFLGVQFDAYGEEDSGVQAAEVHGYGGYLYRPDDPDLDESGEPIEGRACQVLKGQEGGRSHAWVLNDPRAVARLPRLEKGGSIQFGNRGFSYHLINGKTGSHFIYVPYGFDSAGENPTKSCSVTINVDNPQKPLISLVLGDGTSISLLGGRVTLRAPGGAVWQKLGDDGVDVSGNMNVRGAVSLGDETALPVALWPALFAYLQALEVAVVKGNAGGPIPIATPIASVAKGIESRLTKVA